MRQLVPCAVTVLVCLLIGCGGEKSASSDKTNSRPTPPQGPATGEASAPREGHEGTAAPSSGARPTDRATGGGLTVSGQARDRVIAINPSKINITSDGRIVTKDLSYEEMGKLAQVLAEADESGHPQPPTRDEPQGQAPGTWRVEFDYTDPQLRVIGIADVARAVDERGHLLARAKLLRLLTGEGNQLNGAEIEETHLDANGRVYFSCKSQFGFPLGRKTGESDARGRRVVEYFTLWPFVPGMP